MLAAMLMICGLPGPPIGVCRQRGPRQLFVSAELNNAFRLHVIECLNYNSRKHVPRDSNNKSPLAAAEAGESDDDDDDDDDQ